MDRKRYRVSYGLRGCGTIVEGHQELNTGISFVNFEDSVVSRLEELYISQGSLLIRFSRTCTDFFSCRTIFYQFPLLVLFSVAFPSFTEKLLYFSTSRNKYHSLYVNFYCGHFYRGHCKRL